MSDERSPSDREEYERLSRRHKQLTWGLSANDQRERAGLEARLVELHQRFNESSLLDHSDGFDTIMRSENVQKQG